MVSCGFRFLLQVCIEGFLQLEVNPEYTVLIVSPLTLLYHLNNNVKVIGGMAFFKVVHNTVFVIVACLSIGGCKYHGAK